MLIILSWQPKGGHGTMVSPLNTPLDELLGQKGRLVKLCVLLLEEKSNGWEKNTTSQEKLLMLVNKIKAIIAVCIALTVFYW